MRDSLLHGTGNSLREAQVQLQSWLVERGSHSIWNHIWEETFLWKRRVRSAAVNPSRNQLPKPPRIAFRATSRSLAKATPNQPWQPHRHRRVLTPSMTQRHICASSGALSLPAACDKRHAGLALYKLSSSEQILDTSQSDGGPQLWR